MRDVIPFVFPQGTEYKNYLGNTLAGSAASADSPSCNCVPVMLNNGAIGMTPRSSFVFDRNAATSSSDRGRGVYRADDFPVVYLDQDTYYYDGGSQDLKSTSSPGWAGNLGFYSNYIATFTNYSVSGVRNLVICNAGHTSTNASAEHGNVWYAPGGSAAPVSVQSANMPGNNGVSMTRGGVDLDGYFFVCDINGQIHNSNLNDITTWSALDFLKAERAADYGVYLGKIGDNIVYIGTRSVEFFYNAGNASGSPLARRQDVSYKIGTYTPNSVLEIGDDIYFVGIDESLGIGFYRIRGFELTKLSDTKMDERMDVTFNGVDPTSLTGALASYIRTASIETGQNSGVLLSLGNYGSYFYDFRTGIWALWNFGAEPTYKGDSSLWLNAFPIVSGNGDDYYQFTNGTVARTSGPDNVAIDDLGEGNAPDVYMQTPVWDGGTLKKKRINSVSVLSDRRAVDWGASAPITVNLRWFDFGKINGSTSPQPPTDYTTGRGLDLNITTPLLKRLGSTRQRQWLIDWPAVTGSAAVAIGLEIDYDIVE